jgi:hypothetical protein
MKELVRVGKQVITLRTAAFWDTVSVKVKVRDFEFSKLCEL